MKPITIVGGGLAGLTLGILLRRSDVPVTLCEAGHFPRHRVCGEFISGRGRKILTDLGMLDAATLGQAYEANSAAFFCRAICRARAPLPQPALCISRYVLDDCLANQFRRAGGDLREGSRWTEDFGEGVVRATGRLPEQEDNGWRWLGLKAHARNVAPDADLEMHLLSDGYVGVCRLSEGLVNVCGLFRARGPARDLRANWSNWLRGPQGSSLQSRMQDAQFLDETFCAIAGFTLVPCKAVNTGECRLGDAITMTPPLTGNGMSMAIESASLAREPLESYAAGAISWQAAQSQIASRCDGAFGRRLRLASLLQRLAFRRGLNDMALWTAGHIPAIWEFCFQGTRC